MAFWRSSEYVDWLVFASLTSLTDSLIRFYPQTSLTHEDERIRAVSMKLLGSVAPASQSQLSGVNSAELDNCLALVRSHLAALASTFDSADPVELEALALLLGPWLPTLELNNEMRLLVQDIIKKVLNSPSHFVRGSGIKALRTLLSADSAHSNEFVAGLLTELCSPPSHTTFEVVTCISESSISAVLQGHIVIQALWSSLTAHEAVLSESARCSFRSVLFSGNGSLLCLRGMSTPLELVARLDELVTRCLGTKDRLDLANAIFLIDLRYSHIDGRSDFDSFQSAFHLWSVAATLTLLNLSANITLAETSAKECFGSSESSLEALHSSLRRQSAWKPTLEGMTEVRADLLTDFIISFMLRNATQSTSSLVLALMPLFMDALASRLVLGLPLQKFFSFWQTLSKFCKLLTLHTSQWLISTQEIVPLIKELLRSVSPPPATKVAILAAITSMSLFTLSRSPCDWTIFDSVFSDVQACRYSLSWEIRDSLVSMFGAICAACEDVDGCISHSLPGAVVSAVRDSSEFVRTTAYEALESMARKSVWWRTLLQIEPAFPSVVFGTVDSQTISRVSQAHLVRALIQHDHVVETLRQVPEFPTQFRHLLDGLYSDDDWDVRVEVISIIEALREVPPSAGWWSAIKPESILDQAIADESRIVQTAAWKLIASARGKPAEAPGIRSAASSGLSLEEIEELIAGLDVDVHYDPDDEVYPLAPGVADNDLDCPF